MRARVLGGQSDRLATAYPTRCPAASRPVWRRGSTYLCASHHIQRSVLPMKPLSGAYPTVFQCIKRSHASSRLTIRITRILTSKCLFYTNCSLSYDHPIPATVSVHSFRRHRTKDCPRLSPQHEPLLLLNSTPRVGIRVQCCDNCFPWTMK